MSFMSSWLRAALAAETPDPHAVEASDPQPPALRTWPPSAAPEPASPMGEAL